MNPAAKDSPRLASIAALAGELLDAGKPQIAAELAEQIGAQFPDSLVARLLDLKLMLARDRPDEALAGAERALGIDPFSPAALAIALRARRALGESGAGIAAARDRLAAVAPGDPELAREPVAPTRAGIGFMHLRQGRQLLAQRWLAEAMPAEAWPELGAVIAQLQLEGGQIRAALASAGAIFDLLPECLPASLVSAQANAELGKLALAHKHLTMARRFDPEFELARRLYARLPVSRLELPPAPALEIPEMLLARARRALDPPPEPAVGTGSAPDPVGEYRPPSGRFLPSAAAGGEPGSAPEAPDSPEPGGPPALAVTGELARLMGQEHWPAVLELLAGSAHLLDPGQLPFLPRSGLPRLADELVRLGLPELAAAAYRLADPVPAATAPEAANSGPQPEN